MNTNSLRTALRPIALIGLAVLACCGGGSYVTPGGAVPISIITKGDVADTLAQKPAAPFPARIVIARVQGSGYSSYTNRGLGSGSFSVLTARDIETEADFERVASLEGIESVAMLNRLLLPKQLNSMQDLREAAAALRGDIVLFYTVDSVFRTDKTRLGPLAVVGLGFLPNHNAVVSSTCAAALVDARTGFVDGIAETTAVEKQRSNLWNTTSAIDSPRLDADREAFSSLVDEIDGVWADIYSRYGGG
jgi:hypothetical protein